MAATALLGLSLPVTGSLSGTWGDEVNNSITSLLDSAVAGTTTLSTDADVTLTTTTLAANQARQAILLYSGAKTALRNITAPAQSKPYIVINASTGGFGVVIRGVGPTTGVTIAAGDRAVVAWNGTDFVLVASSAITTLTGTLPVASGGTGLTSVTANRVLYGNGTSPLNNSANLTFDGTTLAVTGALTASLDSSFTSTGALLISKGTTAQRTAGTAGQLRFNTTSTEFEGYNGTVWASVGGAALANDTTTSTDLFPLFASATTGTASTLNTSNAKLLYKPSTGELKASAMVSTNGLTLNATTLVSSTTIPTGYSATSVGSSTGFTIPSGLSVTVSSGSRWVIL